MLIRALKQALDHGLILEKVHRVIEFSQKAWRKSYTDMNAELRIKTMNVFEKEFLKLMNHSVLRKTTENVRKQRGIELVTANRRKSYLVEERNCHT